MFNQCKAMIVVALIIVGVAFVLAKPALADDPGLKGWEVGSDYNNHYNVSELDSFKGRFVEVMEITPLPGMAPGIGIKVEDEDGDIIKVHLGPKSFVKMDAIGLKKGDKVKVKGVWADLNKEEVFMASKVKNKARDEEIELKVRLTSDGTPFWTMTREQLAKEQQSKAEPE